MMSKESIRIYYNPCCSKCRETVALASERGYTTELIEYLVTPPGKEELRSLLSKLGMKPLELIRKGEEVFKQNYAGRTLSDEEWLDAMLAHPVLIERPIVVRGNRAVVARPPEKVLALL
ncbi:MAG TPA: arsenate reductase (glutaredoxin) [Gallionellaceae bacterium]|jgi:arsenate reductase|nr:arsenate reductase (glutaredoxin) [Gallionellaceae bacterium]HQS74337.1 arsenate reductase (glutaredoxin) [Gallionellaceae bacterium]